MPPLMGSPGVNFEEIHEALFSKRLVEPLPKARQCGLDILRTRKNHREKTIPRAIKKTISKGWCHRRDQN